MMRLIDAAWTNDKKFWIELIQNEETGTLFMEVYTIRKFFADDFGDYLKLGHFVSHPCVDDEIIFYKTNKQIDVELFPV